MSAQKDDISRLPDPPMESPIPRRAGRVLIISVLLLFLFGYLPKERDVNRSVATLEALQAQLMRVGPVAYDRESDAGDELENGLTLFDQVADDLRRKVDLPELENVLGEPFRLFEFEQQRFIRIRDTMRLAAERGVTLPEDFHALGPSYRSGLIPPQLHWWELEFFHQSLRGLFSDESGGVIRSVRMSEPEPIDGDSDLLRLTVAVELSGPLPLAVRVLSSAARLGEDTSVFFVESLELTSAVEDGQDVGTVNMFFKLTSYLKPLPGASSND